MPWLGAYGPGVGSNSFAVTGDRSASGGALLANDPHLAPSLPGIWYQMNLQCRTWSTPAAPTASAGSPSPEFPASIIGHNNSIAWGFTNNGSDVTDLAYEALNGDRYVRDGGSSRSTTRTETIEVAGGEPVEVTVQATEWGPVAVGRRATSRSRSSRTASTVPTCPGRPTRSALALQWTALQPDRTADAILALNLASMTSRSSARRRPRSRCRARTCCTPTSTVTSATRCPARSRFVRSATTARLRSTGLELGVRLAGLHPVRRSCPWVYDPPEQYIVTANQAVVGQSYPHVLATRLGLRLPQPAARRADRDVAPAHAGVGGSTHDRHLQRVRADPDRRAAATSTSRLLDDDTVRARDLLDDWDSPTGRRLGACRLLQRGLASRARPASSTTSSPVTSGPTVATGGSRSCRSSSTTHRRSGGTTSGPPTCSSCATR